MNINEIREKINQLDDEMKALFDARMVCSGQVAQVKMEQHDEVFKPVREKEIAERFSGEGETWYLAYVRKVIQISRRFQYKQFIDAGQADAGFAAWLDSVSEANRNVLDEGGILTLVVQTDPNEEKGLSVQSVLSVLGDTSLVLLSLEYKENSNIVIRLKIGNDRKEREEAYILAYMLYKEAIW